MALSFATRMANLTIKDIIRHKSTASASASTAKTIVKAMTVASASNNLSSLSSCIITRAKHNHILSSSNFATGSYHSTNEQHSITVNQQDANGIIIVTDSGGIKYAIPPKPLGGYSMARYAPKLAPSIVNRRLAKMRTAVVAKKDIRHSPWRMNLVAQFAAGEYVPDVLEQLNFVEKVKAPLVQQLVYKAAIKARQLHGLVPSQLEVIECFSTHGKHLKRVKIMGRGRSGIKRRRFSHVRCTVREIDYALKLVQCKSLNQRKKWLRRMERSEADAKKFREDKEEIETLEREVEKKQQET